MVTVEGETTPTPNCSPTEEKAWSNQDVANPEHYIKHPVGNKWELCYFFFFFFLSFFLSFFFFRKGRQEKLRLTQEIVTGYQSHADAANKSDSTTKNRFFV